MSMFNFTYVRTWQLWQHVSDFRVNDKRNGPIFKESYYKARDISGVSLSGSFIERPSPKAVKLKPGLEDKENLKKKKRITEF